MLMSLLLNSQLFYLLDLSCKWVSILKSLPILEVIQLSFAIDHTTVNKDVIPIVYHLRSDFELIVPNSQGLSLNYEVAFLYLEHFEVMFQDHSSTTQISSLLKLQAFLSVKFLLIVELFVNLFQK